ncbi:MAG: flagellar basal-body rod protein FlgF [Deltaproteobacteria bacterium]|nr:flagellar basal-body rod protein FlgF [Deltaproteobacteria bacterium]
MGDGIYAALAGAKVCADKIESIANNLANTQTNGFKAERTSFSEVLRAGMDQSYVAMNGATADFSTGAMKHTGNPLDLAINGHGFFVVEGRYGRGYTRAGNFTLNSQGILCTQDGDPVMGTSGLISIGRGEVKVGGDGSLTVNGKNAGRIKIVMPVRPELLVRRGKNLFSLPAGAEVIEATGKLSQGYLETSNVKPVMEVTSLISMQRTFELLVKTMRQFKEMDSQLSRQLRT